MPIKNKFLSVIVLIAVNLFPIFGAIYFGWNIFEIVTLYVLETFIIGLLNAFKMLFTKGNLKFALIPFFLFHYNFFILVQTVFVIILLGPGDGQSFLDGDSLENFITTFTKKEMMLTIGVLAISHIFSFFHNFIGKKQFEKKETGHYFVAPYKRIFVQQFVVIFGAWIVMLFNTPMGFLTHIA
jgi:hypothetical protein